MESSWSGGCTPRGVVEYDINGIVGVRVVEPAPWDIEMVDAQLGPFRSNLEKEPDIIIEFRKKRQQIGLKFLGLDAAGFLGDEFFVFDRRGLKASIPFQEIGNRCTITCESGISSIPFLEEIINFTLLKKEYIPIHASAFVYEGAGVLVTGWKKGGKTEALLSFAKDGAYYLGDEWVILSPENKKMYGFPVQICIWDWQFKYIGEMLPKVSLEKKLIFTFTRILNSIHEKFGKGKLGNLFPFKYVERALPALNRQLNIRVFPEEIFGDRLVKEATLDKIFFMMCHDSEEILVEPYDLTEVIDRVVQSNTHEQMLFWEYYNAFRFAFPKKRNEFLERSCSIMEGLLRSALLNGVETYRVLRPYPVSFPELFKAMQPACSAGGAGACEAVGFKPSDRY